MPKAIPTPNDLYSGILTDLGYTITPSGDVMEQTNPVYLDHRHLVLPTNAKLKEADWIKNIPFHPLCENVYRGESSIIQFLRNAVTKRMTQVLGMYIFQLAEISRSKDQKMSQEVKKFLQILPDVDDKFVTIVTDLIVECTKEDTTTPLIHVFLKRGGTVNGTKVSRAAIVTFPILEKLQSGDKIGSVAPRKKDIPMLNALFNYAIFGEVKENYNNKTSHYNYGSTDLYAPYFDAMAGAYYKLAKAIKDQSYKFRIQIAKVSEDDLRLFQPDLSWIDFMKDISTLRALIPILPDSEGAVVQGQEDPSQSVVAPVTTGFVQQTVTTPIAQPVQKVINGSISGAQATPEQMAAVEQSRSIAIHPSQVKKNNSSNTNPTTEQAKEQELSNALAGIPTPYPVAGGYPQYPQQPQQVPLYLQGQQTQQPVYQQPVQQPMYPQQRQLPLYLQQTQQQVNYQPQPNQFQGPGYGL